MKINHTSGTPFLRSFFFILTTIVTLLCPGLSIAQNVGISTVGAVPDPTAGLDINYTDKGLLIPRVALTQTTSNAPIGAGVAYSLLVFNTQTINDVTPGYYYWDGAVWVRLGTGGGPANAWWITGNGGTVDGTHFVGTTDNIPLNFRVNNLKAGRIDAGGPTFFGYQAGNVNTALSSTAFGYQALFLNAAGLANTAAGYRALYNNTAGNNSAFGYRALYANTNGQENTGIGWEAMYANTLGYQNTALGAYALHENTTANANTAVGYWALRWFAYPNGGMLYNGFNVAVGYNSLSQCNPVTSTAEAIYNTGLGSRTLENLSIGAGNTAVGYRALRGITSPNYNTAIGFEACSTGTTYTGVVAAGYQALRENLTGSYNVAMGYRALYQNTSGANNTAIGYQALSTNTTGSNNLAIGYNANVSAAALTNASAIGNGATVATSNTMVLGNNAVTQTQFNGALMPYYGGVYNAGAAGNVLTSQGAGVAPQWAAPSAGVDVTAWHITGNAGINPATNFIGTTTAADFVVRTNNTEVMRVTSGARVGIGITAPNAKFVVLAQAGSSEPVIADAVAVFSRNAISASNSFIGVIAGGSTGTTDGNAGILFGSQSFPTDGAVIYNNYNVAGGKFMVFRTNAAERVRIDNTGRVGIGTTTPGGQLELSLDQGRKPATNVWTIPSDERLKNIEGPYTKGLTEILQLKPILYHYKNSGDKVFKEEVLKTQNVGFSAQEVQKIFPEAVGTDDDGYLNLNIHSILIASINAIQEQQKMIDSLKGVIGNAVRSADPWQGTETGSSSTIQRTVVNSGSAYQALLSDTYIGITVAEPFTVHLPSAAAAGAGKTYIIKRENNSGNILTIDAGGSSLIDGTKNYNIPANGWAVVRVISTGTEWMTW